MRRCRATSVLVPLLLALAVPPTARAQSIRQDIRELFHFGTCPELVCLVLTGGGHGEHFKPDADLSGQQLIDFLTNGIAVSVLNVPLSGTSSGAVVTINEAGLPTAALGSLGPVFGERWQTLGRGRLLVGVNYTAVRFTEVRGEKLDDLRLTLTHENEPGAGGDLLGDPPFERDVIDIRTSLEASADALVAYATYGLTNTIDVGVAVPVVRTSVDGHSLATIVQTTDQQLHIFGTEANPSQTSTATSSGSATGIGDIAARIKLNLRQSPQFGVSVLGDLRLPTGDEDNLHGSGSVALRALGILSAQLGSFSPHGNVGYVYRGGETQNSAVLTVLGFDQIVTPRVTLAVDAIGQWQVGQDALTLPEPAHYIDGSVIQRTSIPDVRDDLVDGSVGVKVMTPGDFIIVGNSIFALNNGGVRADVVWTLGLERTF
jgi:Putative MetA-pathway of phenol degradation